MTHVNRAEQLAEAVATIWGHNGAAAFRQNWETYKQIAEVSEIQGIFFGLDADEGRYNVAIIGDGRIVDIDADDGINSGGTFITSLSSIGQVILLRKSLASIPRSIGASLLLVARFRGTEEIGPYWVAKTPEEEERLLSFARTLVQAVSDR